MKLVVANLKMNLLSDEITNYIKFFKEKDYPNVVFAPSNIYLTRFVHNGLNTISQDVGMAESGAYTGDVSYKQLESIGIKASIIGHSERRKYYNDNNYVAKKAELLLNNKMAFILCVGETKEERESVGVFKIVENQLDNALNNIDKEKLCDIIIAYEPVWSIGTNVLPKNEEIEEVISFIKNYFVDKYQRKVKVLYGGSVNNNCINDLEKIKIVDGYLVGGCSTKIEEFDKLINAIK